MTTIQLIDVADPPSPPPPLKARVAVMVLAILMIGAGVLAMAAGPEPRVPAIDSVEGAPTPAGQASNDSP